MVGVPLRGAESKPRSGVLPSKCGSTLKMAANIKVVVRVRPLNEKEREANNRVVVEVVDNSMLVFDPKEETRPFFYQGVQQPPKNVLRRANKELKFVFDNVLGQKASNKDIFELTTKDVLVSLMEGYNCSVFAYGATGAGKTFTMIGSVENPGITYLTMDHLFYTIDSFEKEREFDIGVSYIEVYNENVFDLLKPSKTPLQLREDAKYGVMVAGLTMHKINTARELLNMLENGNKNRTQHPTDANAESSRSHAVFQVYIKMRYKTSSQARVVKLSMIDLAGSERASATGCVGERFKEGANINRSLLSLGNCINKLADGSSYIPYRDSKLTRLLKDSLGGNCKTVMIANISPSSISYEDTYNTLKYAARANKIQLSVKKNIVDGAMKVSQYLQLIEELKNKVTELEAKLSDSELRPLPGRDAAEAEWRRRIAESEKRHVALESSLLGLRARSKVLALRHQLQMRAYAHVACLAHRSSNEAMELMLNEDIPRHERATENYEKKARNMDSDILLAQTKCDESWKGFETTMEQARRECPDLEDYIDKVVLQRDLRLAKASNNLRGKLLWIQNKEINLSTEYMAEMPNMLRKLYLTLMGYDKLPPMLTEEYMDMIRKAKSIKSITWDTENECNDPYVQYVSSLNTNESDFAPNFDKFDLSSSSSALIRPLLGIDDKFDTTVETAANSEDTDIENRDPAPKKRKGTPIKLANNETIVIDDSFDNLDFTRTLNSAKKVKRAADVVSDVENCEVGEIDPKDVNSTFVLAAKMNALKKPKLGPGVTDMKVEPVAKRGLTDRTNVQRTTNFNRGKIAKPAVSKAPATRRPGFGSSLARDGTPLFRTAVNETLVGYKAARARDRPSNHSHSRPAARR